MGKNYFFSNFSVGFFKMLLAFIITSLISVYKYCLYKNYKNIHLKKIVYPIFCDYNDFFQQYILNKHYIMFNKFIMEKVICQIGVGLRITTDQLLTANCCKCWHCVWSILSNHPLRIHGKERHKLKCSSNMAWLIRDGVRGFSRKVRGKFWEICVNNLRIRFLQYSKHWMANNVCLTHSFSFNVMTENENSQWIIIHCITKLQFIICLYRFNYYV